MSQHTNSPINSPTRSYGPATPWPHPTNDLNNTVPEGWQYGVPSPSGSAASDHHHHHHQQHHFNNNPPDLESFPGDRKTWAIDDETVYSGGDYSNYSGDDNTLNGLRSPSGGGGGGGELSLDLESPILISPERASDYAKMSMSSATPPPSNISINTYIHRFINLVKKIHRLPWMAPERVTVDYYPEKGNKIEERKGGRRKMDFEDLYDRRDVHVTAVSWKSRDYIAWRESHYGHVAGFGSGSRSGTVTGSDVGRTADLRFSGGGGSLSSRDGSGGGGSGGDGAMTMSPGEDVAAIIEPFPYQPHT